MFYACRPLNMGVNSFLIDSAFNSPGFAGSRPAASHFSLLRQRKVTKRKATRSLGPCASLRATSGARSQPSQDGVGNECKVRFGDALTPALSQRERE